MVAMADGGLLACANNLDDPTTTETIAAILVTMYIEYATPTGSSYSLLVDAENCRAIVGPLGTTMALCIWGNPGTPPGILHAKFQLLYNNLSHVLNDL